ncbi:ABC-2 transporter permease [Lawsonibacter celer]|jgi:ABC-2 type transport system permease protein|uniref:ABC-2 transporter permease n=1 Tax=Lawsonibacter celer TaxID=2986526 RepID=UPI0016445415|nr:ABC-2 transporter permease [Lawsonibacter celer]
MIGFVYKDFLLQRKQLTYVLVLCVVYSVLSLTGTLSPSILSGMVMVLGMVLPMSAFSYDDLARWDKFAASTPAGRRGIVAGRYLFTLLLLLLSAALVAVLLLLFRLLGLVEEPLAELLLPVPICAAMGLVVNAIILPLLYQFGVEKARLVSMILFAAIFGGIVGLGFLAKSVQLPALSDGGVLLAALVLILVAAALFALSHRVSQGIFARKEL